jgi:hypothetical protein
LAPPRQPNSHLLKDEGEQKTGSSGQDEVVDLEGDLELEGLAVAARSSAFVYAFAGGGVNGYKVEQCRHRFHEKSKLFVPSSVSAGSFVRRVKRSMSVGNSVICLPGHG